MLFCLVYQLHLLGVQPDISHAHAQRQEAIHVSRLRQRVLPELRPQETLAKTSRRPLSPAPARNGRVASHGSRAGCATTFATAAAERPPRTWHVRAAVPAGPVRIPQERNHVAQLAASLLTPDGGRLGEAVSYVERITLYNTYIFTCNTPKDRILYNNVLYNYGYLIFS